jgi:hypothetical protein
MSPAQFRRLALDMPDAIEAEHMGHPDFRVGGSIFASLFHPKDRMDCYCIVKLTPAQQRTFIKAHGGVFERCSGAWGRAGATQAALGEVNEGAAREAIIAAWCNTAPKRLLDQHWFGNGK